MTMKCLDGWDNEWCSSAAATSDKQQNGEWRLLPTITFVGKLIDPWEMSKFFTGASLYEYCTKSSQEFQAIYNTMQMFIFIFISFI